MLNPAAAATASSSRVKYSAPPVFVHGATAPSDSDFSSSGTTSSGSTSVREPRPVHSGQAPHGPSKENSRGSSASRPMSTKSTRTTPPASPSVVSTDSVSRCHALAFTASRSTTVSIECFLRVSSGGGPVSG